MVKRLHLTSLFVALSLYSLAYAKVDSDHDGLPNSHRRHPEGLVESVIDNFLAPRAGKRPTPSGERSLNRARLNENLRQGIAELRKSDGLGTTPLDLAKLVDPFIGSEGNNNPGNVHPGASQPFGMLKFGPDIDDNYAPAGYITNTSAPIRGFSPLHDSGTGAGTGSYGNFESFPIVCPDDDFHRCSTTLDARKRPRKAGHDYAEPGYFTLTLDNDIKAEMTTTRRAALIRYTFPKSVLKGGKPHIVQDWSNDLPGSFRGGEIDFDIKAGRVQMNGSWGSSFGPGIYSYQAHACIDTLQGGKQSLGRAGLWQGDRFGQDAKLENVKHANLTRNLFGGQPVQAGALFSFDKYARNGDGSAEITLRIGISYNSNQQACANAEEEIGDAWDFDAIVRESRSLWNEKLNRISLDPQTDETVARLFYTDMYYAFLTPANATLEAGNLFEGGKSYTGSYWDSLYCSWDSFRTFFPFLSLTSAQDYAQIAENYIDSWRKSGWLIETRANNLPGAVQGGSNGVMVVGDFAAKYWRQAFQKLLPTDLNDGYSAVMKDAYVTPPEWSSTGRQVSVYSQYGYVPFAVFDPISTGRQTREASRTLEYAHNDFAAAVVALVANHPDQAKDLFNRSFNYKNTFDNGTHSFGFSTFVQKRAVNGTFIRQNVTDCSPVGKYESCSLEQQNTHGVYETSSWEYSFYAPHDVAGLMKLIANGNRETFVRRLDTYFEKGLFYAGNEPGFNTPVLYHYANAPTKSAHRVRKVIYQNFNTTTEGLPGNSDVGAMQTLLNFHLLGLFPVPATTEFLLGSPLVPSYTIHNDLLGTARFVVKDFDPRTVGEEIPQGSRAFVESVSINGKQQASRCKISFLDMFPIRAPGEKTNVTITLQMTADEEAVKDCGKGDKVLPSSLSTGGFTLQSF